MTIKATRTIEITRIIVLFNCPGRNGSYDYSQTRQLHQGEHIDLVLLHYRPSVGTFWGNVDEVTESRILDRLNEAQRNEHARRLLLSSGHYYSRLIVQHAQGEEHFDFTVLVSGRSQPCVVTGGTDHESYNPERIIVPAIGGYLAG